VKIEFRLYPFGAFRDDTLWDVQRGKPQEPENQKAKGKNQKAKIPGLGRGPGWSGIFAVWPQKHSRSGVARAFSRHGGIHAAMGFDAGRDAGVAGQRPAPRSAPDPKRDQRLVLQETKMFRLAACSQ
jgi:hypothetical protein